MNVSALKIQCVLILERNYLCYHCKCLTYKIHALEEEKAVGKTHPAKIPGPKVYNKLLF